jgi:hypothetical protein
VSLVNTFPLAFLEVLLHSMQNVGRNCCHFFRDVLFQVCHCPWFLFVHLALEISSEEEVLRLGTVVPMNIEVPAKYVSTAKARCFTDQHSMATEMLLSFARRAFKDKFPTPTVPLNCVTKSSGISAGPCNFIDAMSAAFIS